MDSPLRQDHPPIPHPSPPPAPHWRHTPEMGLTSDTSPISAIHEASDMATSFLLQWKWCSAHPQSTPASSPRRHVSRSPTQQLLEGSCCWDKPALGFLLFRVLYAIVVGYAVSHPASLTRRHRTSLGRLIEICKHAAGECQ